MALLKCPDCQGMVSSAAAACPRCGHPQPAGEPAQAPPKPPATKGSTQRIPLPPIVTPSEVKPVPRPASAPTARRSMQEGFQNLGNGKFVFGAGYAESFRLVQRAIQECGFAVSESSMQRGFIRADAKIGLLTVDMTATFYQLGEDTKLEVKAVSSGVWDYSRIRPAMAQQVGERIEELARTEVRTSMQGRPLVSRAPDYSYREDICYRNHAISGFWLAVVGLFSIFPGVLGLVYSGITARRIAGSNNKDGQGWAHAGLIIGVFAVGGWLILVLFE